MFLNYLLAYGVDTFLMFLVAYIEAAWSLNFHARGEEMNEFDIKVLHAAISAEYDEALKKGRKISFIKTMRKIAYAFNGHKLYSLKRSKFVADVVFQAYDLMRYDVATFKDENTNIFIDTKNHIAISIEDGTVKKYTQKNYDILVYELKQKPNLVELGAEKWDAELLATKRN